MRDVIAIRAEMFKDVYEDVHVIEEEEEEVVVEGEEKEKEGECLSSVHIQGKRERATERSRDNPDDVRRGRSTMRSRALAPAFRHQNSSQCI